MYIKKKKKRIDRVHIFRVKTEKPTEKQIAADLRWTFPGQCVPLKTGLDRNIALKASTAAALDANPVSFRSDWRGSDHNTRNLDQSRHQLRLSTHTNRSVQQEGRFTKTEMETINIIRQ